VTFMFSQLNNHEEMLIAHFLEHPVLLNIAKLKWSDFLEILIQRRFLSLSIVNVYEFVIDALDDWDMKNTVRSILSEEFPRNSTGKPLMSHRELLFQDLLVLGATRDQILRTTESEITRSVRTNSLRELLGCLEIKHMQLGVLSFLRFWGEVLVSEEYTIFWNRLSERLSSVATEPNRFKSQFYYHHMIHDRRRYNLGDEYYVGGLTHSEELACHISNLVNDEESLSVVMRLEEKATILKHQFYDQFTFDYKQE
jgi:hypothetical protein